MRPIADILEQKGFLNKLFEAIPCGVLIVDSDRRVQAVHWSWPKGMPFSPSIFPGNW